MIVLSDNNDPIRAANAQAKVGLAPIVFSNGSRAAARL